MATYLYRDNSNVFEVFAVGERDQELLLTCSGGTLLPGTVHLMPVITVSNAGITSDFPSLWLHIPVFSERAWNILKPLVEIDVQILPLVHPTYGSSYFAINVLTVLDCLDLERTELVRNEVSGNITWARHQTLRNSPPTDVHIFKTPQTGGLEVYVSQTFKECVESNGLKGLKFKQVPQS
jgi:hypothetical protein